MSEALADRSKRGLTVIEAEFDGENKSGIEMVDYKVLVLKDTVEETSNGIFIPQDIRGEEVWTVCTGVIVSHGDAAFTHGRKPNGDLIYWGRLPTVGTRVGVKEYAGQVWDGHDGKKYHVYTDKDIVGPIAPESKS